MDGTDSRTRHKVTLNPTKVLSKSVTGKVLPTILLSHVLYVVSLYAGKEWVLALDVGVPWVLMRVLALGGLGVIVWELLNGKLTGHKAIEWSLVGMASLCLLLQQASMLAALSTLPATRVIMFTLYSTLWPKSLVSGKSAGESIIVAIAIILSFASDASYSVHNVWTTVPGYMALGFHAIASIGLEQTNGVFAPSVTPSVAIAASTLGACALALPLYLIRKILVDAPEVPVLPLGSLAVIPVIAYSLLYLTPKSATTVRGLASPAQSHLLSFPTMGLFVVIFGFLAFSHHPTWTDPLAAILLFIGLTPGTKSQELAARGDGSNGRLLRFYLKTILANPESRKIFYFLILNMWFMLVQMLYGVWTNSLGLISDAIHMAFDCMAIGVGLIASVMATWPANERFTYGYGRIETLSGFSNGIFLILISIFIIFEAVQRLLDPPEMSTNQLLLISSLGLGVNLFGMFAMGGHAHHGHSHSHGGGHSHAPPALNAEPSFDNHGHHDHDHDHSHSQSHSHSHSHSPPISPIHSHAHSPPPLHAHSPPPLHEHSHSHAPPDSPIHDHSHSHSHSPAHSPSPDHLNHDHSHSHSHSPSPPLINGRTTNTKRQFRGPSIQIPTEDTPEISHSHDHSHSAQLPERRNSQPLDRVRRDSVMTSPLTPNYSFGHDDHFAAFHQSQQSPNLHDHSHASESHHEGHSHNMRGVFLHVMADTLGSVGVIISTLLIHFYGWTGFDPIASLFIAVLIAASVVPLVIDTGKILALDVSEREHNIEGALKELGNIEGLASFTQPRFWPKDDSSLIGSIHVQLAPSASSFDPVGPHSTSKPTYAKLDRVVERVDMMLRSRISGLEELTIQVEEAR